MKTKPILRTYVINIIRYCYKKPTLNFEYIKSKKSIEIGIWKILILIEYINNN